MGSATPDEAAYRAKHLNYPNNNAFDKSGVYSKSLKVADDVIKAERSKAGKSVSKKSLMARNCSIFLKRFLKKIKAFISRQFSRKVACDTFFDTL